LIAGLIVRREVLFVLPVILSGGLAVSALRGSVLARALVWVITRTGICVVVVMSMTAAAVLIYAVWDVPSAVAVSHVFATINAGRIMSAGT